MARAVARLFADRPSAQQAVEDLTGADFDPAGSGMVMQDKTQTKEKARTPLHRVPPALLIALALVAPGAGTGHTASAQDAVGVSCAARVAVLGADLTPVGRAAVRQTLGLGPGETALTESLVDERVQAHGLIPPALLGVVAVSSVVLRPAPTGSGLRVMLDRNITLYPAQAYANALLIAGVSDAAVSIAAPSTQRTLGTTALLGVLRAARLSCGATNRTRQDLAVRAFVLTNALAARTGYAAVPLLMTRLTADAATGHVMTPGALATLVDTDAARLRLSVPSALRPDIARFLGDLAASHVYDAVAAAGPRVGGAPPFQAVVSFARPLGQTVPGGQGTTTTLPTGQIYRGTAAAGASLSALGVRLAGGPVGGLRLFSPAADARMYRDGARVTLAAIQRGDMVTVTTDVSGRAVRIDATSRPTSGSGAVHRGIAAGLVVGAAGVSVREGAGTHTYHTARALQVSRNGKPSTLGAIQSGDSVVVTTDASGQATRIEATSQTGASVGATTGGVARGTIAAAVAVGGALAVREANGTQTYRAASGLQVYRDGKRSSLGVVGLC